MTHVHHAMQAVDGPTPKRFKDFDLRFFRRIGFSDTFDGDSNPSDGMSYHAILYGKAVIAEHGKHYMGSAGGPSFDRGMKNGHLMWLASRYYLDILGIARRRYFGEKSPNSSKKKSGRFEKDWDCIYVHECLPMLRNHPMFKNLIADFGMSLRKVRGKERQLRVCVSKRAPQDRRI